MKKKIIAFAMLLMAVVITSGSVSGTYAKYTSTIDATADTAKVAAWAINVEGENYNSTDKTFDLFKNAYDLDENGNVSTDSENHMKSEGSLVAPGTGGYVTITVTNDGDVTAAFSGQLSKVVNADGLPLEFSGWNEVDTWVKISTTVDTTVSGQENALNDTIVTATLAPGESTTMKIYWRWLFENGTTDAAIATNDATDTTLGTNGTAEVTVTAKLTATQVD